MGITELAASIEMPPEMTARLRPVEGFAAEKAALLDADRFEAAANALHEGLSPDEDGTKILSAMLEAATMSEGEYAKRKIPHEIYLATMKAFSRFVREHYEKNGAYGFSTWWWAGRQTSLKLFRVGALEYEMCTEKTGRELSIHIPSDADLSPASVDASLAAARAFFARYYPAFRAAPFSCCSWMLDPALEGLLPPNSNIRAFAARFTPAARYEKADYFEFVFKVSGPRPVGELPEKTFLQRSLKAHLAAGGSLGVVRGFIKNI